MADAFRWGATGLPGMRRALIASAQARLDMVDGFLNRLRASLPGAEDLPAVPDGPLDRMLAQYTTASLYWVTADMASLALDASHDIPDFDMSEAPDRSGIMAIQTPLPPLPISAEPGAPTAPPSVISWYRSAADEWSIEVYARKGQVTRATRDSLELYLPSDPLVAIRAIKVPQAAGQPAIPLDDETTATPSELALVAWLSAAWRLMVVPTLVDRRTLDARTGESREPGPDVDRPDLLVSTLDLRPLRQVDTGTEADPETGRVYTHRWMVRGHWRQQAYGPGRALRRTQYVEPYIKGPAGAPLLARDKVWVWRR